MVSYWKEWRPGRKVCESPEALVQRAAPLWTTGELWGLGSLSVGTVGLRAGALLTLVPPGACFPCLFAPCHFRMISGEVGCVMGLWWPYRALGLYWLIIALLASCPPPSPAQLATPGRSPNIRVKDVCGEEVFSDKWRISHPGLGLKFWTRHRVHWSTKEEM